MLLSDIDAGEIPEALELVINQLMMESIFMAVQFACDIQEQDMQFGNLVMEK